MKQDFKYLKLLNMLFLLLAVLLVSAALLLNVEQVRQYVSQTLFTSLLIGGVVCQLVLFHVSRKAIEKNIQANFLAEHLANTANEENSAGAAAAGEKKLAELNETVIPIWLKQIATTRQQTENEISVLANKFSNIVERLSHVVTQKFTTGEEAENEEVVDNRTFSEVVDDSKQELQHIVDSLRNSTSTKNELFD
ncbi:MAG: hypothetical protein R3240_11315, partial [Gammaproteobacteria bacterium]|nr:hypothetical protein [Gammaproteobacteria bacterium]